MDFFGTIAIIVATATFSACDASTIGRVSSLGSGSYTDNLLGNRFVNKVNVRSGLSPVVKATQLDVCDGLCPIGTVCTLDMGVRRCVADTGIAVVETGYGAPTVGLTSSYGSGVPTVGLTNSYGSGDALSSGAASIGIGSKASFANNGYGSNFGISSCGMMAPECLATRRDLNPVYKYTFDHDVNRCVRVSVCMTCANFNSVRDNLFDSRLQCARFCQ